MSAHIVDHHRVDSRTPTFIAGGLCTLSRNLHSIRVINSFSREKRCAKIYLILIDFLDSIHNTDTRSVTTQLTVAHSKCSPYRQKRLGLIVIHSVCVTKTALNFSCDRSLCIVIRNNLRSNEHIVAADHFALITNETSLSSPYRDNNYYLIHLLAPNWTGGT